ncbi:popy class I histocompatibility antigen, alpha chain E-like [Ctenopharyngodon idella]|uniref:popy class I histocompatibility antigen, alpha chain E-like n=1 Tax=Ctenopharyngodon idella TaxID=7959 RepID=UPI00222FDC2D|nr:popy class I histocompatibility antigen, alpha chain E-like [Ctenopharyngodon idella]
MTLDLEKKKYMSQMQDADNIAENWNNKPDLLEHSLKFIIDDCVIFLQRYLDYGRATFNRKFPPKVSLLQKNSSSPVLCHATGFYPAKVNITWRKNGQEYHEYVETGETLPNPDKTFQKHVRLKVKTEEWKRNQYSCVVQHKSLTKDIQKILTEDEIISNSSKCNG